mmetsp:Transcript_38060/g.80479  ORF Transcript_38060/g.80479 Transcript_38060/m.80479 type:complete len:160 (+) Transcript_38060:29-508(+)
MGLSNCAFGLGAQLSPLTASCKSRTVCGMLFLARESIEESEAAPVGVEENLSCHTLSSNPRRGVAGDAPDRRHSVRFELCTKAPERKRRQRLTASARSMLPGSGQCSEVTVLVDGQWREGKVEKFDTGCCRYVVMLLDSADTVQVHPSKMRMRQCSRMV